MGFLILLIIIAFSVVGVLKTFENELNRLVKHVDMNKGPSGIAKILFLSLIHI